MLFCNFLSLSLFISSSFVCLLWLRSAFQGYRPRLWRDEFIPSRRRVLAKGYAKTRRAGGELLRRV